MIGAVLDALAGTAFRRDDRGVLFAPFGDRGRQTPIPSQAEFDRLWRGTRLWCAPFLLPLVGVLVLSVGRRAFEPAILGWGFAAVLGAFGAMVLLYGTWARRATARLLAARDEAAMPVRRRLVAEEPDAADRRRAGLELLDRIQAALTDGQGIHAESLLVATGALAGFSCQMSVRRSGRAGALMVVETANGEAYFLGDAVNAPLIEAPDSVWRLVAEVPVRLGSPPPAIEEIVAEVVRSLGDPSFDRPALPGYPARHPPLDYLQALWPAVEAALTQRAATPSDWPAILAFAAQRAVVLTEELVPPAIAAEIVMRCAVTTAKVDPARVNVPA